MQLDMQDEVESLRAEVASLRRKLADEHPSKPQSVQQVRRWSLPYPT